MKRNWLNNGPIYIGGPDRCGKTTLRAFLASHSRIAIPAVGSNMWTYFYGQYGDLRRAANFDRCLHDMLNYKHVHFLRPDAERIRREFAQGPPTYAHLFALFLVHFAEREGKPRWGAQTGLVERYADPIFAAYPAAKIIHMIRDPRDRYEASLARWPNGKGRVGGATARWRYSVDLARRNQRRYPDRYKVVRFESMVLQPEETLRDLCEFLDEAYEPAMLSMEAAPTHRARMEAGLDNARARVTPVSDDFIGLFRGRIPERELAFMQLCAGRSMRMYGYPPEPLHLTPRDWLHFAMVEFPLNLGKMWAWRSWEHCQHHLPRLVGRQPGRRMILRTVDEAAAQQETQPTG